MMDFSLIHLSRTAQSFLKLHAGLFARALCYTHLFANLLTTSLARGKVNDWMSQRWTVLNHSALHITQNNVIQRKQVYVNVYVT